MTALLPPPHRLSTQTLAAAAADFRALLGELAAMEVGKISDRLNPMMRLFVECSPFVCLATGEAAGRYDVNPPTATRPAPSISSTTGSCCCRSVLATGSLIGCLECLPTRTLV